MENNYYEAIEELVNQGYVILQLECGNEYMYFAVYKWQESYFNTAQSIDFNTIEGINITKFLRTQSSLYKNARDFISRFEDELVNAPIIRCEFSKGIKWYKWGSPTSNVNKNGIK
jgi:hypothetical protein